MNVVSSPIRGRASLLQRNSLRYLWSMVIVVVATALLSVVLHAIGLEVANIALGYIVAVLLAAITYGLGPGVLSSILAFLAYNFFFVPPTLTFTVANRQDLIRLFLFLGVAVVTSSIAANARTRAREAQQRAEIQETLYDLSQAISAEVDADTILPTIAQRIITLLPVDGCTIQILDGKSTHADVSAGNVGNVGTAVVTPLRAGERTIGLIRVWEHPPYLLNVEARRLLDALARQAALAVERSRLAAEATRLEIVAESDRTK